MSIGSDIPNDITATKPMKRGLQWSEPAPGKEGVSHYDHVIAETPLGQIKLEWKSWKEHDSPGGMMPWDEWVVGNTLDEAKADAQRAWDVMIPKLLALCRA
jgi:hypothetical protein